MTGSKPCSYLQRRLLLEMGALDRPGDWISGPSWKWSRQELHPDREVPPR